MNAEIFAALRQLEKERGIPVDYMVERITQALVAAYKKDKDGYTDNVYVELTEEKMFMYAQKEVVDEANGIQSFPFEEREIIMRPGYRKNLLSDKGVLLGGSNYAQSMLAKGAVSPDAKKEFGNMYCGEIDMIPCYYSAEVIRGDTCPMYAGTRQCEPYGFRCHKELNNH